MVILFFFVLLQGGPAYTIPPFPSVEACEQGARAMRAAHAATPGLLGNGWACVRPAMAPPPAEKEKRS